MSESADSVTVWINRLKTGDERAPNAIWQEYFTRLMQLARSKLQALPRAVNDEEDIALSAMKSFFKGVRENRFPQLSDRDNLGKLLFVITARKVIAARRRHHRAGSPDAYVVASGPAEEVDLLQLAFGAEPTPEAAAIFAEAYQRRLEMLPSAELRRLAVWKLEGYTNREIAAKLYPDTVHTRPKTAQTNVERKFAAIRRMWLKDAELDAQP